MVRETDLVESEDDDTVMTTTRFEYRRHGSRVVHVVNLPVPIQLPAPIWGSAERSGGILTLPSAADKAVFSISVSNSDLSTALYDIFGLIERDPGTDLHELVAKFVQMLIDSNIGAPSIHAEMIARGLVRSVDDPQHRPDFTTGPDEPVYQVLRLSAAVMASSSVTNALAFERLREQLTRPSILTKFGTSAFDAVFGSW